jgi:haloalkane dehalogenase
MIAAMMGGAPTEAFRTPEERFQGLPDFDYEPHYREVDGLRLANLDVGDGPPILFIHGEPTWSFVWRKVIPPLVDAGYRCIAVDLAGCGRSDKPSDPGWYSLERHAELMRGLLNDLDLRDLTMVVHDWGGPIGLTLMVQEPDRISRAVVLDTVLDPSKLWMSERWVGFREFVERTADFPAGAVMRTSLYKDPGEEVIAGYDAPYLGPESKVSLYALPLLVERSDRIPEGAATVIEALRNDPRQFRIIWGEEDMVLTPATAEHFAASIGRQVDEWIPAAGHGVPEDQGELLGERIAAWLAEVAPTA